MRKGNNLVQQEIKMRYSTVLSVTLASQAINSVNLVELEEILFVSCLDNGTTFGFFPTGAGGAPPGTAPPGCNPNPAD